MPRIAASATRKRPDREGRKLIAAHLDLETATTLRILAAEKDTTISSMIAEAIGLLFKKHGKPVPAALTET